MNFYDREREMFPIEHKTYIDTQKHIEQITHKLCRHYGLPKVFVRFCKNQWCEGKYYYNLAEPVVGDLIQYAWNKKIKVSILAICHEVAHHYEYMKKGNSRHAKPLLKIIKRMLKYCKKHEYWGWAINGKNLS